MPGHTVIAFHTLHDANVCITEDGKLLAVLELERLFAKRYFCSAQRKSLFTEQWTKAVDTITKYTGISTFDVGVTSWVLPSQRTVLQSLVQAKKWVAVDHHNCHTALGFYDSPFNSALILSYDGGGNDGAFNIYHGDRTEGIKLLKKVDLNLGAPYRNIALAMSEVTGEPHDPEVVTSYMRHAPLALSGKVMGYAALGTVQEAWVPAFFEYYTRFGIPMTGLFNLGERLGVSCEPNALENSVARDVAATSQYVFSQILLDEATQVLNDEYQSNDVAPDGIVLTGGCALNVHANQMVVEQFGYPVHVASAPNDCGISVGAAWCIQPPSVREPLQYAGLPLLDANLLESSAKKRGARKVSMKEVAGLLVRGAIIGIVKGRQEFGPRALGHRSLVCYPNRASLKEEINRLKSREWFRPLCPAVTERSAARMFLGRESSREWRKKQLKNIPLKWDGTQSPLVQTVDSPICLPADGGSSAEDWVGASPYMSFAPPLTAEAQKLFPAITHYDGTARLQTVSPEGEPWFHSLLEEVGRQGNDGGYEILLNTSFNVKGKPILNHLNTALQILDSSPEGTMTHVLAEDWLFTPQRGRAGAEPSDTTTGS
ncbi:uncharacterized protein sll1178-like [Diadema antillarum]|uniref:uncharacterized protein sll1178-like n=1 Tax=Diadema antillarum TaxID=105358 RepID=UPI003A85C7DA